MFNIQVAFSSSLFCWRNASSFHSGFGTRSPRAVGLCRTNAPFHDLPFELAIGFPRAEVFDDLGFEQSDDGFGQCVVAAVPDASNRHVDSGVLKSSRSFSSMNAKNSSTWTRNLQPSGYETSYWRLDHRISRLSSNSEIFF